MKQTKPKSLRWRQIQFNKAISGLTGYLTACNGIPDCPSDAFYVEWRGEVDYIRDNIVEKQDRAKFDKIAARLEKLGMEYGKVEQAFNKENDKFLESLYVIENKRDYVKA